MSGVAVIRYLLANDPAVLAWLVAKSAPGAAVEKQIVLGDAVAGTARPLLLVSQVDSVPLNFIRTNEANKLHTDRVQVTYLFSGPRGSPAGSSIYSDLGAISRLVLAACPSQRGTIAGVFVNSITPAGEGPDLSGEDGLLSRSRDFLVRWSDAP